MDKRPKSKELLSLGFFSKAEKLQPFSFTKTASKDESKPQLRIIMGNMERMPT